MGIHRQRVPGSEAVRRIPGRQGTQRITPSSEGPKAQPGPGRGPGGPAVGGLPAGFGVMGSPPRHGALPSELGAGRTCPPPQEGSCLEGLGIRGQKSRCGCARQAVGREPGATHAWDSALQQGPSPRDGPCCNQGLGWRPGAPSGCSWTWPLSHGASAAHPALPGPLGTQRQGGGRGCVEETV